MTEALPALAAAARALLAHYPRYLPGILLAWFAAEAAPAALARSGTREAVPAVFVAFLLPLLVRPAVIALGQGAYAHRALLAFASSGLYGFALLALLVFAPIPVLLLHFAGHLALGISLESTPLVLSAGGLSAAVDLFLLLRLWPVLVVTYLYPGRETWVSDWGSLGRAWLWSGPSFRTAWRITGRPGGWREATLPWGAAVGLPLAAAVAFRGAWAEGLPAVLSQFLLYGAALPYAATATAALALGVRVPCRGFDPAAQPKPESEPPRRAKRPTYVRFPADGGTGVAALQPGGVGMYFAYLSNRNRCTYLFDPRPVDAALLDELSTIFEPGYATLFLLEKYFSWGPDEPPPLRVQLSRRPVLADGGFCVFRDPEAVPVGSGAVVSRHPTAREAVAAAVRYGRENGVGVVAARVVTELSWH